MFYKPVKTKFVLTQILFYFLLSGSLLYAQVQREQMIGSYIYNFANNVIWPNEEFKEFKIALISSGETIIQELKQMANNKKIKNKTISLSVYPKPSPELKNAQIIFVSSGKSDYYLEIFDIVEGEDILLVSENFENKNFVMLNLYDTDDQKLLFEINKPNILNQRLKFTDELLLMGGTEIDIASVYLKSQQSLRRMDLRIKTFIKKLDSLQEDIKNSRDQITNFENLIQLHKNEIELQNSTIESQVKQLETAKNSLTILSDSLNQNEKILDQQNKKIEESKQFLDRQKIEIDSINQEIDKRNLILSTKERKISWQQNIMNFLIVIILVILILIGIIIYAYHQNREKSRNLIQQKQKIDQMNRELSSNNDQLKKSLDEIKQMQQHLVQSEKMASLGVLSAGIAHEINNPINFVYAGINSLQRDFEDIEPVLREIDNLDPESVDIKSKLKKIRELKQEYYFDEAFEAIPEIIKDIRVGADRTAEIVKGLRSFSRTDSQKRNCLKLHEAVDTALLLLKNKYKNHVKIIKKFDPKIDQLKCYPAKINQVFLNILSNGIDAIEDQGNLLIDTAISGKKVIISIKDDGCGMSEESIKKIFDPFYTTKSVGDGTGLGLSISYGIIKELKGEIRVKSQPGQGSEFIITLPQKCEAEK